MKILRQPHCRLLVLASMALLGLAGGGCSQQERAHPLPPTKAEIADQINQINSNTRATPEIKKALIERIRQEGQATPGKP